MVQRSVYSKFALQNFRVDHRDESRTEVVTHLDQFATLDLLIIFDGLSLLRLQVLVLRVERCVECGLQRV